MRLARPLARTPRTAFTLRPARTLLTFALVLLAATARADLDGDVRLLIDDDKLKGATVGVSIRDPGTRKTLVAINDRSPLIPASNMKLITTGAALHAYGPDFFFRTRLLFDGKRLIVAADGDPAFGDPELLRMLKGEDGAPLDEEGFLRFWTGAVVDAGVRRIDELIIDDRIFDREYFHPEWPKDQLSLRYCAEVSGLIFHLNVLHFFPKMIPGQKPDVTRFRPYARWLDLSSNRATCRGGARDGNTFGITRPAESNNYAFTGNVKSTYYSPVPVTLHDMPSFFARLLADRLERAGVQVGSFRLASEDDLRFDGAVIGPVVRSPISTVVTRCNTSSQNLYAEALIKRLGYTFSSGTQPGSWHTGAAAIRMIVSERIGDKSISSAMIVSDGSGLSRENRITAALMTAWLDTFHRDSKLADIFINSLALGGETGTLDDRFTDSIFRDYRVQAKSGYINGVSCLSGYITAPDGRRRTFSILVNDLAPGTVRAAKRLQESIVREVVEDMIESRAVASERGG